MNAAFDMNELFILFLIAILYYSCKLKNDFILLARMAFGIAANDSETVSESNEAVENEPANSSSDAVRFERWRRVLNWGWRIEAVIIVLALGWLFYILFSSNKPIFNNFLDISFFDHKRQIMECVWWILFDKLAPLVPTIAVCIVGSLTRRKIKKTLDVWQAVGNQRNELTQNGFPADKSIKRTFYYSLLTIGLVIVALIAFIIVACSLNVVFNSRQYQREYALFYDGFMPAIFLRLMTAWFVGCLICKGLWQFRAVEMKNAVIHSNITTVDPSIIKTGRFETAKNILIVLFLLLLFCNPFYTPFSAIIQTVMTALLSAPSPSHFNSLNGVVLGYSYGLSIIVLQLLFGYGILKYLFQTLSKSESKRKGEPLSTFFMVFTVLWLLFNILHMYNGRYPGEPMGAGYGMPLRYCASLIFAFIGVICVHLQAESQKSRKVLNALAIALSLVIIALPF